MSYNLYTGLVSYWKLDGNSNDSIASNNGTDTSITYNAGNGRLVQGAGFVAGNSSKIAMTSSGLPTGTTFSMQAWWKGSAPVGDGIFGWGPGGAGTNRMIMIVGNNAYFGGNSADLNSNFAINDGNWHHIVVTCNAGAMTIYVDGTSRNTGTPSLNSVASQATRFGCRVDDSSFLTGAIDEVGVWSTVLSSGDVTTLYNGGAGLSLSSFLVVTESEIAGVPVETQSLNFDLTATEIAGAPIEASKGSFGWGGQSKSSATWSNQNKSTTP